MPFVPVALDGSGGESTGLGQLPAGLGIDQCGAYENWAGDSDITWDQL